MVVPVVPLVPVQVKKKPTIVATIDFIYFLAN